MHRSAVGASLLASLLALACGAEDETALKRYGRHLSGECASCHRPDGAVRGSIPSLAGRPAGEIESLLKDYREGRKTNPVMVSVAQSLDEKETAALAAYFAALPKSASAAAPPR